MNYADLPCCLAGSRILCILAANMHMQTCEKSYWLQNSSSDSDLGRKYLHTIRGTDYITDDHKAYVFAFLLAHPFLFYGWLYGLNFSSCN
jgi:hypothetical protein